MKRESDKRPLVQCLDLAVGHGKSPLFQGIHLVVERGEWLALVGPNGAGKTTLMHTMLGLLKPVAGQVQHQPGLRIGYVPQRGQHDTIFPLSALDVVRGGGAAEGRGLTLASREAAMEALVSVGLGQKSRELFRELSGGQQQRLLLARALVRKPDLLALDEPTAGMDIPAERDLMELVSNLSRGSSMAVILVTHQLYLAARYAHCTALLDSHRHSFVLGPTPELMTSGRLSEAFEQPMSVIQTEEGIWVAAKRSEVQG